jgi:hypothetical protein
MLGEEQAISEFGAAAHTTHRHGSARQAQILFDIVNERSIMAQCDGKHAKPQACEEELLPQCRKRNMTDPG